MLLYIYIYIYIYEEILLVVHNANSITHVLGHTFTRSFTHSLPISRSPSPFGLRVSLYVSFSVVLSLKIGIDTDLLLVRVVYPTERVRLSKQSQVLLYTVRIKSLLPYHYHQICWPSVRRNVWCAIILYAQEGLGYSPRNVLQMANMGLHRSEKNTGVFVPFKVVNDW